MKKVIFGILVLAIFALFTVPAAAQEVCFVPHQSSAAYCNTEDVEIWVNTTWVNTTEFQGGQINQSYDPTCIVTLEDTSSDVPSGINAISAANTGVLTVSPPPIIRQKAVTEPDDVESVDSNDSINVTLNEYITKYDSSDNESQTKGEGGSADLTSHDGRVVDTEEGSAWHIETVDTDWGTADLSLALDRAGNPHIIYNKYAFYDGSWHIVPVEGAGGNIAYPSLALDDDGKPHISYYDLGGDHNLKYAHYDGSSWHIDTVDSHLYAGGDSSIVLDNHGKPHICYCGGQGGGGLKYAYHDGNSWHIDTVDSVGGYYISLALDEAGKPHISYYYCYYDGSSYHGYLKYAYYEGGWHIETVDSEGGSGDGYTSLALDGAGNPHISYIVNVYNLKYAHYDGSWHMEIVDSEGFQYTSLALDGAGNPHICYQGGVYPNLGLKYAYYAGSWHIESIEPTEGDYLSLALDNAGNPHICYMDWCSGDIKYAYKSETPPLEGWPMFRHDPSHTGVAVGSEAVGSPLQLIWKKKLHQYSRSSPAVGYDKVFVGAHHSLYALDERTGEVLWEHDTNYYIGSSPAVGYGRVFVGNYFGGFYGFLETGDDYWYRGLGSYISSSPVVADGKVFVGTVEGPGESKGKLFALWADTGANAWSPFEAAGPIYSSPAVANGKVFFGCNNYPSATGTIYCLDANDGHQIWSYPTGGGVVSSPTVAEGKVFVGCNDGNVYALDEQNGHLLWSYDTGRGGYVSSSPAFCRAPFPPYHDGMVIIGCCDGYIYCLNPEQEELFWSKKIGSGDTLACQLFSSPALYTPYLIGAAPFIYIGSDDSKICVLDVDGFVLEEYPTGGSVVSSPAIANGKVFVGSDDHYIYAFGESQLQKPDLVIDDKWEKWNAKGDKYTVHFVVKNIGDATAPKGHTARLFVDGVEIEDKKVNKVLKHGKAYTGAFKPVACTEKIDTIKVCADIFDDVKDELDEDNNCEENELTCTKPDLVIDKKWETWDAKGDKYTVHFVVKNVGDAPAPKGHTARLFVDGAEIEDKKVNKVLKHGKTYKGAFKTFIPFSGDSDIVGVCADDDKGVDESDEDNNCEVNIVECSKPDLVIDKKWETWDAKGDKYTVHFVVKNVGDAPAPKGHTARLFVDGAEIEDKKVNKVLKHGKTYKGAFKTLIPFSGDSDIVGVCADDDKGVDESDEDNNCEVNIVECPKPDLVIDEKWEEWTGEPGYYKVHFVVKSIGTATVPKGHSATLTVDGTEVQHKVVPRALKPGKAYESYFKEPVKCTGDFDTIEVCADNFDDVKESDELNNCLENEWICEIVEKPDLVIEKKWEKERRGKYKVYFVVKNIGAATAPGGHYATLSVDDEEIEHKLIQRALRPGKTYRSSFKTRVVCTGDFDTIEVCADDFKVVDELDETNNCLENEWICKGCIT